MRKTLNIMLAAAMLTAPLAVSAEETIAAELAKATETELVTAKPKKKTTKKLQRRRRAERLLQRRAPRAQRRQRRHQRLLRQHRPQQRRLQARRCSEASYPD